MRISDLHLRMKNSAAQPRADRLHTEFQARGLHFFPTVYLSTEWLCPDRVPLIGIPFCLAHPRLFALEKTMMLEVEGGTKKTCMEFLRHEAGHAINYAYKLYHRTRWRELFGPISQAYDVGEYYPRPYSRQFVEHLPDNYAQAHPDEDFAETFAVWLTPGLDWRRKYRGWKAMKKLEYVDHLMNKIGTLRPAVPGGKKLWPVGRIRTTLQNYYRKKRIEFGDGYPGFYDPELYQIFTTEPGKQRTPAAAFLHRYRRHLTNQIAAIGNFRKYEIGQIIRRMQLRAKEVRIFVRDGDAECLMQLSICLTRILSDYRIRRKELHMP